ncbi:MAG: TlpA family protein disulfide reductase [Epsilonproteobacteria bacterium]|nr:TlpA family protein disulfide reductase [Campylobacterota bacterium]
MKKYLLWLATVSLLLAYQKGDTLDKNMVQKLQLDKDKIYIVDFFASWCISCKREIPFVNKLYNKLDKNKVDIIGIDVDEEIKEGERFQNMLKNSDDLSFRVVNDPNGEIVNRFNPVGMPSIYIIKNNKVEDIIIGAKDDIDKLLSKKIEELQ